MKKKKKSKKNNCKFNSQNVSKTFVKFAEDYVSLGNNLQETENYLNFACVAWNLSLFNDKEMKERLNIVVEEYGKLNPETIKPDHLKHDLEILVEKKRKYYSHVNRIITKIYVEEKGNSYKISTESIHFTNENLK